MDSTQEFLLPIFTLSFNNLNCQFYLFIHILIYVFVLLLFFRTHWLKTTCPWFFVLLRLFHHHGLRMPREEIAFTALPKIQSQSQIFRYGRSIFCLPHRTNFSDIFIGCLMVDRISVWLNTMRAMMFEG